MDVMTVRRGLLYFGVFLVAIGGVTLLASAGVLDEDRLAQALDYWPIAVIAIGVALVLRGTSAALPAGIVAAAVPGLMLGGMLVAVPHLPVPCTDLASNAGTPITRQGTFSAGAARVDLELSCGEMAVTAASGAGWSVDARNSHGHTPDVVADASRLSVTSAQQRGSFGWNPGADSWQIGLPEGSPMDLDAQVNAGSATLDLGAATLPSVTLDVNAGDVTIDLGGATVNRMDVGVNAGSTTIHLPSAGGFSGSVEANAGAVTVCVPPQLALRVTTDAALGSIDINGLVRSGDAWTTPGYDTAQSRADLSVQASVGSVTISPEGACK
jgi:hypothetical protein